MSNELLKYYNRELAYLRKIGAEFAEAHPGVAANLGVGAEGENDPFVGRLIEAVAFLNARTRFKIEDDFPEISGSMLDVLYPHYQRPFPSASIAQFQLDIGQADRLEGHLVIARFGQSLSMAMLANFEPVTMLPAGLFPSPQLAWRGSRFLLHKRSFRPKQQRLFALNSRRFPKTYL